VSANGNTRFVSLARPAPPLAPGAQSSAGRRACPPLAISGHHPAGFAQPGPRTRCYGNTPRPASGVSCPTAASWPFQLVEPWPSTASCAAFSTLQSSPSTHPTTGVAAPVHRGTCQADLKRRVLSDAGNCRAHKAAAQLNAQGFADAIVIERAPGHVDASIRDAAARSATRSPNASVAANLRATITGARRRHP
jgi:hypothetical protein